MRRCCAQLGVLALAACSATGYEVADLAAEINGTRDLSAAVVVAGDTIRVTFPFRNDWNQDVRVRPDGVASFRLLDDLPVAGLSIADLDARLTERYAKLAVTNADQVTVDLVPGGAPMTGGATDAAVLYVIGEVDRAGPLLLTGRPLTLIEAIAAAGGHRKTSANLRNTILIRRLPNGEMKSWRLDADIYRWGELPPIWLQARDVVFVPNTAIDGVNIWVDKYIRQMIPLPTLLPPTQ